MDDYSFLFSPLTIHSYKTCSPQPWIIYHFFLHPEKSAEGELEAKARGPYWLFVYLGDWWMWSWSGQSWALHVSTLPLTGTDRKEGASCACLAQKEMFALGGRAFGKPHFALQSHPVTNSKSGSKFLPKTLSRSWDGEMPWQCKDQSLLWLSIRIIWRTFQTRPCSEFHHN